MVHRCGICVLRQSKEELACICILFLFIGSVIKLYVCTYIQ